MFGFIEQLNQFRASQPIFIQALLWLLFFLLVIFILYLLFSLIFFPLMFLYNQLTDKNKSNVLGKEDYLIGELTTRLRGNSIGEVIEIGSETAISVYPAKFYREEDRNSDVVLPIGTKVLIIDFDEQGIALVVKSDHF
ncbi:hypothetical protein [Enterococcus saccharolyticus]|uniref:NfeD-like C-terminal domain-containing protein n=1 Tax=Enterococcus saccharolyticus subsp. saccharolyticus ATCC 43076 TaxID=1139996 RepID=S0NWH2_9ENTE|nr:hypothetical protein [Enterococcus saccharolyticus]EOT29668.1 hypothetical protein OMQ_00980 [Enterococcus saccharolyticus subsp. saccharolyticus ATCC 43076]EOT80828.1 hypothetical protein I572_01359 [Enterococcus saccharolyticus subsp. saccharolyticus ATCC 43076]